LGEIDDISLDIHGQLLHVLHADAPTSAEESEILDDDSDDTSAGPIALAMDVNEAPTSEVNAA